MPLDTENANRQLRAVVDQILANRDPIGLIGGGAPEDEYKTELDAILPLLRQVASVEDVQRVVHGQFARLFGGEGAGGRSSYRRRALGDAAAPARPSGKVRGSHTPPGSERSGGTDGPSGGRTLIDRFSPCR
jgi:hypothetical protein